MWLCGAFSTTCQVLGQFRGSFVVILSLEVHVTFRVVCPGHIWVFPLAELTFLITSVKYLLGLLDCHFSRAGAELKLSCLDQALP